MSRDYTAVPHEYLEEMEHLSEAEFGRLMRALLLYSMTGEEKNLSGGEKAHWVRVRNRENRYQESFENNEKVKTERAKNAANARWSNAKNANASASIPSNAKNANTNTNTKTKTDTKADTNTKDIFAAFAAEDSVLMDSLTAFEQMRKKIKKPLTDRAKTGICKKLVSLAGENRGLMAQILDQSILHCWQDVYALKDSVPNRQPVNTGYVHGADRLAQMIQRGDFDD